MSPFAKILLLTLPFVLIVGTSFAPATDTPKGPVAVGPVGKKAETVQDSATKTMPPKAGQADDKTVPETVPGQTEKSEKGSEIGVEQTQTDATKILNDIIDGMMEGDFNKFSRNLSPEMQKGMTRQAFLQWQQKHQKNLGKLKKLTYMGFYEQLGKRVAVFKAKFEKATDDALITIAVDSSGKEPQASGLWFDHPALVK
jgi:predicted metal-dependent peptidase